MRQVWQERGRGARAGRNWGDSPAEGRGYHPWNASGPLVRWTSYGGRDLAPAGAGVPFRQRVAAWRARNWRRAVLAWFVLSLIIVAVSAEPATAFPKAQARSVPAVRMVLRVAGGLTVAGVPVLLIALP